MRFDSYQTQGFRDEMFDDAGVVRPEARLLLDAARSLGIDRASWTLPAPYAHWLERYRAA